MTDEQDRALVVAVPERHLRAAADGCADRGWAVLPAGGPGDLDATSPGTLVLVIVSDDLERMPGATWSAVYSGRVPHEPSEPWPDGVPETWTAEHAEGTLPARIAAADDDDDDDDEVGPQAFLRVTDLAPLPRDRWVHANELVPKQRRGGRAFLPRTPRLVRIVD